MYFILLNIKKGSLVGVQPGEPGDQVRHGALRVHAADQLLGVVTEELEGGEHGQAAVVDLLDGGVVVGGAEPGLVGEGTGGAVGGQLEINIADEGDDLCPAQGRDGLDGGNAVGDGLERDAGGDFTGETERLRGDVTQDGQLAHTAVLQLGSSVEGEGVLVHVAGKGPATHGRTDQRGKRKSFTREREGEFWAW